ncbi:MAG: pyridoxamine 5'-phosphate oxidase family protein [Candidatus Omnitrophica bacterium]|nr:pyridoxamine 5'-phosphate oxidase family protein [Candidatus Omnitrophota bacterium]
MPQPPNTDIAFTPTVKEIQERLGSREGYARKEERGGFEDTITEDLALFIAHQDSFYLGTANLEGQPYIQHRGGPHGFLRVIDRKTLAFADFAGNKQYISFGNLRDNPKAILFLVDYPNRKRVKIWGEAEVIEDDSNLLQSLLSEGYEAKPERVVKFHVKAWEANCPAHLTPRYTEQQVVEIVKSLKQRIWELEDENRRLKDPS